MHGFGALMIFISYQFGLLPMLHCLSALHVCVAFCSLSPCWPSLFALFLVSIQYAFLFVVICVRVLGGTRIKSLDLHACGTCYDTHLKAHGIRVIHCSSLFKPFKALSTHIDVNPAIVVAIQRPSSAVHPAHWTLQSMDERYSVQRHPAAGAGWTVAGRLLDNLWMSVCHSG
jgi:hypothetical protein